MMFQLVWLNLYKESEVLKMTIHCMSDETKSTHLFGALFFKYQNYKIFRFT
jgi:hypothetical protein